MTNYDAMTDTELNAKMREYAKVMDTISPADDRWDEAYKEYFNISAELDERYRKENMADFNAFYEENIKGKRWEEIDPEAFQMYSDWHKEMYGYRPRNI